MAGRSHASSPSARASSKSRMTSSKSNGRDSSQRRRRVSSRWHPVRMMDQLMPNAAGKRHDWPPS
eukprot:5586402-Prymnesium_polylepis.1